MRDDKAWDQPTEYEAWYTSSLGKAYGASIRDVLAGWLSSPPDGWVLGDG